MYIVNTSFVVEAAVQERWLELVAKKYIPFLKKQGFGNIVFTRVVSVEADDHFTYSLQVGIEDLARYGELTGSLFDEYRNVADGLFGERVLWFTSLMKRLDY